MVMTSIVIREEHICFGGRIGYYSHESSSTRVAMNFAVYQPPLALEGRRVPAVYFLAGLTCTEETFMIKAGAQRLAAQLGLMLVSCDTSPRGLEIPDDSEAWDIGTGAGFYVDATVAPWSMNYRMNSYVGFELPSIIEENFPASRDKRGIFGHSMGGHGALVLALRNPNYWHSVSAFSPICNPCSVPWGEKAFSTYLGDDHDQWSEWDASMLMRRQPYPREILIDQGDGDQFLQTQLKPDALKVAAEISGQKINLRMHAEYDHSYWFIQSFINDHLYHHNRYLNQLL